MKIRKGFVSNSSSSSYTCEVCGETVSGMEMCHGSDDWGGTGMFDCEKGHTVCKKHAVGLDDLELDEAVRAQFNGEDEDSDDFYDAFYKVSSEHCPICQMESIRDEDLLGWCLKRLCVKRDHAEQVIREAFPNYDEFMKGLKNED